jgi:prevent-host-death family protein
MRLIDGDLITVYNVYRRQNVRYVQEGSLKLGDMTMEKIVSSTRARDSFSTILDEVQFHGNKYFINRKGKPAAVLVPIDVYESWKQSRQQFFDLVRSFQEASGDNDPAEIMELVLEAQKAVRQEVAREVERRGVS